MSGCLAAPMLCQRSGGAGFLLEWIPLQVLEPSQHSREFMYKILRPAQFKW